MAANTTTSQSWVQKTPGVCGGDACVRNSRITVHGLVHYRQLGFSDEQIMAMIQGLTQDDLVAASAVRALGANGWLDRVSAERARRRSLAMKSASSRAEVEGWLNTVK